MPVWRKREGGGRPSLAGRMCLLLGFILVPALIILAWDGRRVRENWISEQLAVGREEALLVSSLMDQSFRFLEEEMAYLPYSTDDFQKLCSYEGDLLSMPQEFWLSMARVQGQMGKIRSICSYVEALFAYYPGQDIFLYERVNPDLASRLKAEIQAGRGEGSWQIWEGEKTYLSWYFPCDGYYLGVWISGEAIGDAFLPKEEGDSSYLLTDLEGRPLEGTGGIEASAVPSPGLGAGWVKAGEEYLRFACHVYHPGLYLVSYLGQGRVSLPFPLFVRSLLPLLLLLLVLLLAVLFGLSRWVLRPMREVVAGVENIRRGEVSYRFPSLPRQTLEYAQIREEINRMVDELSRMRMQFYEQEIRQNQTKLRYLSQQIQSHFILNSLNMVYAVSARDVAECRRLITLLAVYYRYVVYVESEYVQLGQELDHIEAYLQIQKSRYGEALTYEVSCPDALRITPIPPFLLESFVGNSLKYGQDEEDRMHIEVLVRETAPFEILILLGDRGPGYEEETLEAIESFLKDGEKDEMMGAGIYNCLERLRLIYQERALVRFYNREEGGAMVEIRIRLNQPGQQGKEDGDGSGSKREE